MAPQRTLFDKIWDNHVVAPQGEGTYLIYIDLHLIHEVTTPQAFEVLKLAGRKVSRVVVGRDHDLSAGSDRVAPKELERRTGEHDPAPDGRREHDRHA